MNILQIVFSSWWSALLSFLVLVYISEWLRSIISLWIRHRTIVNKGYPPDYCNSDGTGYSKEENSKS